jgi:hypothetical protein
MTANNDGMLIRTNVKATEAIGKGKLVNEAFTGLASGSNGIGGVAAYDIAIGDEVVIEPVYEEREVYAGDTVTAGMLLTAGPSAGGTAGDGFALQGTGAGTEIFGIARSGGGDGDKINVWLRPVYELGGTS